VKEKRNNAMDKKFLLVAGKKPDPWAKVLAQALAPLGSLEITTQEESLSKSKLSKYAVTIIDSTAVAEPARLITDMLTCHLGTRVVVATFSPTWKRAREVIRAGAMDYFPKTMVKEELRQKIEVVMQIPVES
jgi:DNA-binding NarL/FixJ family response regulator